MQLAPRLIGMSQPPATFNAPSREPDGTVASDYQPQASSGGS